MQYIFHPVAEPTRCDIIGGIKNYCDRPARYTVDQSQEDVVSYATRRVSHGEEWTEPGPLDICLHHASRVLQFNHATFRVVPSHLIPTV